MSQLEAHKALASSSRMNILAQLYRQEMDLDELAKRTNMQPITLRHHLQALREAGFIEEVQSRQMKVGRPRSVYRIAKSRPVVQFPKRQYLSFADTVIRALEFFAGDRKTAEMLAWIGKRMGRDAAKHLSSEFGIEKWTPELYAEHVVKKYFHEMGAEPEVISADKKKVVFRMHNCLFHELAQKKPELICDVLHDSFHEALFEGLGKNAKISRPKCMAHGDPYCEQVCLFTE